MRKISPRLGGMASLALKRFSIRCRFSHESGKSPLVRIGVTTLASLAMQVILRSWFRFETRRLLVTIAAWNRHMASSQAKLNFVVSAQAECRWQKPLEIVAMFTSAEVGRRGELPGMFVGVAIRAQLELHRINRG